MSAMWYDRLLQFASIYDAEITIHLVPRSLTWQGKIMVGSYCMFSNNAKQFNQLTQMMHTAIKTFLEEKINCELESQAKLSSKISGMYQLLEQLGGSVQVDDSNVKDDPMYNPSDAF